MSYCFRYPSRRTRRLYPIRLIAISLLSLFSIPALAGDSLPETRWDTLTAKFEEHYYARDFQAALSYAQKSLEVAEAKGGKEDSTYGESLNNLSVIYMQLGYYEKALPLCQKALKNTRETQGKEHKSYGVRLNNLALLHKKMDHYEKALSMYQEALDHVVTHQGKDSESYRTRLNNMASLYKAIGLQQEALKLYRKVLEQIEKKPGKNPVKEMIYLNNIAGLYRMLGRYQDALDLYNKVLTKAEKNLGKDHFYYGKRLNNLALLHKKMGRPQQALSLYKEALRITGKNRGKDHPEYGASLSNLAVLYHHLNRYDKAMEYYQKALANIEKNYGKHHSEYTRSLNSIASLYQETGQYSRALDHYQQVFDNLHHRIDKMFSFLSEQGKREFIAEVRNHFNLFHYFTEQARDSFPQTRGIAYNNELLLKGIVLTNTREMRESIRKNADQELLATYQKWNKLRTYLTRQYTRHKKKRTGEIDSLEEAAARLERTLVGQSNKFRESLIKTRISWEAIRDTLEEDETAIEFMAYRTWDGEFKDTTRYAALLLTANNEQPRFIRLFDEHELQRLLNRPENMDELAYIRQLYSHDGQGRQLYNLIWSSIQPHLEGIKTVYYSPAGLLHQLNLKVLPEPEFSTLNQRYQFVRLNSTRKIVTGAQQPRHASATMFGGIRYAYTADTGNVLQGSSQPLLALNNIPGFEERRSQESSLQYLEGSLTEVKRISKMMSRYSVPEVKTGAEATEMAFKQLSGNSRKVLHISTHGFFLPDPKITSKKEQNVAPSLSYLQDPMFRSGLALASSNYAWLNGYNPYEKEDGILTAHEIANLDLSNTDLVVLSACETGLGEIRGSEGVYGLQRAFRMAGVEYLIMSLWDVPDRYTTTLMETFYSNWLNGTPIRQAFRSAQQELAKGSPPSFWGAFVLVGGGKEEPAPSDGIDWLSLGWITGGALLLLVILVGVYRQVRR